VKPCYDVFPDWLEELWLVIWPRFYARFVIWRYRRRLWSANLAQARLAETAQRGAQTWTEFLLALQEVPSQPQPQPSLGGVS